MWEVYSALVSLLGERGRFSQQLFVDMYRVRDRLDSPSAKLEEDLCFCALRTARTLKRRLPDFLHNWMVIGTPNGRRGQYVAFCERLGRTK